MSQLLSTVRDLLTWRTPLPAPRPKALPSSDFVDYRSIAIPAYTDSSLGAATSLARVLDPDALQDAEVKVSTIYACLRLISTAIAEAPLAEYLKDANGKGAIDPSSRIAGVLEAPNAEQGGADFRYSYTIISAIFGHAILELGRGRDGRVGEIYPRVPTAWTRRQTQSGKLYWEVIGARGERREVPVEDAICLPYEPHPRLKGYGISPLKVIEREAGVENLLTAYLIEYLEHGAIIPHVITTDQPIYDPAQVARAQIQFQQYQGGGGIGKPPVLSGGMKIESIGNSVDDMAWPDLRGISELKICQGFGVQPHLVGAKDAITNGGLATTELREAMQFFQTHTIAPLRVRQTSTLTRALLRPEVADPRRYLGYDISQVAALQENRTAAHERARADLLATGITLDEYRAETGRDPLPAGRGRVRLVPFNLIEQSIDSDPEDPAPPPAKTSLNRSSKKGSRLIPYGPDRELREYQWINTRTLTARQLEVRSRAFQTNRNRQEQLSRQVAPKLDKFFTGQKNRIINSLGKSDDDLEERAFADMDWTAEQKRLEAILKPHHQRTAEKAMEDITKLLDLEKPLVWDVANPYVDTIQEQLGTQIVDISERTRLSVSRTIADGLAEGMNLTDLAGSIEHLFEETYKGRAMTIARTETQVAYNLASTVGYRESGQVDECELYDNPDHDEDYGASDGLTCAERNGMIVPIGDAEEHIAGEHPNGSLAVAPIVRKEE